MTGWLAQQAMYDSGTVHVTPLGDAIVHVETLDCLCRPVTEPVMRDDGSNGWLVSHNAFDGREA